MRHRLDIPSGMDHGSPEFIQALNDRLRRIGDAIGAQADQIGAISEGGPAPSPGTPPPSVARTLVTIVAGYDAALPTHDDGGRMSVLQVTYTPPANSTGFAGVHAYEEDPEWTDLQQGSGVTKLDSAFVLDQAGLAPDMQRIDCGRFDFDSSRLDGNGNITISLPARPRPAAPQNNRVWLVAYTTDRLNPYNVDPPLDPRQDPWISIAVKPTPTSGIGREATNVFLTDLDCTIETRFTSRWEWRAVFTWTDPENDGSVSGFQIEIWNTSLAAVGARQFKTWTSIVGFGVESVASDWAAEPAQDELMQAWGLSVNKSGNANKPLSGITPYLLFTAPGIIPVANVTFWSVAAGYGFNDATGDPVLLLDPNFVVPTDESWASIQFWVHILDTDGWVQLGNPFAPHQDAIIPQQFFPTTAQTWDCYAVSVDTNGKPAFDTTTNPPTMGSSPVFTVAIPAPNGGDGEEYANVVTNFQAQIDYSLSGDGVELYGFSGSWDIPDPVDPRYQGNYIIAIDDQNRHITLGTWGPKETQFHSGPWPIVRPGATFTLYCCSKNSSNLVNSIHAGVTPQSLLLTLNLQTAGKLKGHRLDAATLSGELSTDGGTLAVNLGPGFTKAMNQLDLVLNSTDLHIASGELTVKNVDLLKALNYNTTEFTLSGGQFLVNGIDLRKVLATTITSELGVDIATGKFGVAALSAAKITAGTLAAGVVYAGNIVASQIVSGTIGASIGYLGTILASQVTTGTLGAGVVYAGTINATQVNAGTMSAVNISGGTMTLTVGTLTTNINNTTDATYGVTAGVIVKDSSLNKAVILQAGTIRLSKVSSSDGANINTDAWTWAKGTNSAAFSWNPTDPQIILSGSSGTAYLDFDGSGRPEVYLQAGAHSIQIGFDGSGLPKIWFDGVVKVS